MTNVFVCYYKGDKYWKIGRITSRLTPSFGNCVIELIIV